jgi:matrix metalloproteinase-14 (membrane-inserted)
MSNLDYSDYVQDVLAHAPRCGVIDSQPLGESKWGLPEVTYSFSSYVGGMAQSQVETVIRQAFDSWEAVCGLKFRQVAASANIDIGAARGSRANFDGPNGTLAWAYLPSGNRFTGRLQVRLDLDERWIADTGANGILLLNVAAHEFGHAIGLSHINSVRNQLLNPTYNKNISKPQSEDIKQSRQLYGAATTPTPTPADPATPTVPVGAPRAIKVLGADGRVWGFSNPVEIPPNSLQADARYEF